MTDEEIKIVFDWATIQEAKEMVKEILKDFL